MKKQSFLSKQKTKGSISLVELSNEISKAYLIKSEKCIKVAKLAYEDDIYENAVTEAYYSIYNTVLSLFFKCGIKCENHSAAVLLVKDIFKLKEAFKIFSEFKEDRIDNQYYIPIIDEEPIEKEKCDERIITAQKFNVDLRAYMEKLTNKDISKIRDNFEEI